MHKYRSICRFTMLILVDGKIMHVKPNQVIESADELFYTHLKKIVTPKKVTKAPRRARRNKSDGNDSKS